MGQADTDLEERTLPVDTDGGDHDRFAHYCNKADIARSIVTGEPITALCGKTWVPSRDPLKYPVCPTCRDIYSRLVGS